jgi:glyoxylase-like metal-dependent hydrolase (beta-lactamase superfamily II)
MGYFKVFLIDDKTWYIKEKLGVGSFLFEGGEKALLLDTCNGFRDIRGTVAKLTGKPLVVVNSHGHADHAGGNGQFPEVFIHGADVESTGSEQQKNQRDRLFRYAKEHYPLLRPVLWWLENHRPHIYDTTYRTIEDGAVFALGERTLKVLHCPGHSPGSILLTDDRTKTLYVGDAINYGLFLFFEDSPALTYYAARIRKFTKLTGFEEIRISHSENPLPFDFIAYYADFLERVSLGKSELTDIPNGDRPVYKYSETENPFGLKEIAVHFTKDLLEEGI